jgi:hypothetical protein
MVSPGGVGIMGRIAASFLATLALAGCSALPGGGSESRRSEQPRRVASAEPRLSNAPEVRQCLSELGIARASFEPLPDKFHGGGCTTVGTVKLASLRTDQSAIGLPNIGPVTCTVAETFAGWARYGADRAARQILGSPLRSIETMGSFSCRTVAGSGRLSAHATADAIDIGAFILEDGRRISVLDHWHGGTAAEREFLRVVHQSACKRFGTVLGPDYNSAHENHFHVEKVIESRAYCR